MRVLYVAQFFNPEPAPYGLTFVKALRDEGHDVRVITGFPNYPGGKLYPGFRMRWRRQEFMDGIQVMRVPLYPSHDRSRIGRILNYGSFCVSAILQGCFMRWRPDVLYVYHPPLTVGIAGAVIGGLRRIPFILDVQDLWPDTLRVTGMINHDGALKLIGHIARWVYHRAVIIIPQSPGFVERIAATGVPPEKIDMIYNWANEEELLKRPATPYVLPPELQGKTLLGFAGTMGAAQAVHHLLSAAKIIQEQRDDIRLFFVGGGTEVQRLKDMAQSLHLHNVLFIPGMPINEVGALLDHADGLLVHLQADPLFDITMPSKIQAYMFAGKPIIAAVRGNAADLVAHAQCGLQAEPENPTSIAEAMMRFADLPATERIAMGQRGRTFYDRELRLGIAIKRISALMQRVVANAPSYSGAGRK